MKEPIKIFKYAGYEIEVYFLQSFDAYTYVVKNNSNETIIANIKRHEDMAAAYVSACLEINEVE